MEKITTVGIDLAKAVFSLHGVDGAGRVLSGAPLFGASALERVVRQHSTFLWATAHWFRPSGRWPLVSALEAD